MDRVTADVERGRWTGMFDEKKLMKNQKAVSEVVGEVLLTTIAVLLVSSIGYSLPLTTELLIFHTLR
jgi:hypothetical protein